jgi:hypothetical protein
MAIHRTSSRSLTAFGVALSLLLAAGCGAHHEAEDSPPPLDEEPIEEANPDDLPPPPDPPGNDCADLGETKECTVDLPEVNGVKSCFVGLQVCETQDDGSGGWSECTDQETVDEKIAAMEAAGDL